MKKCVFLLLQLILTFSLFSEEKTNGLVFKQTEYVTLTYKSSIDEYTEFKKIIKGTYIKDVDFLKLTHPEYKLIGWEKDGILIKNGITLTEDVVLYAKWKRKTFSVSDVIQIIVVFVALLAIAIPLILQRKWYRQEQKEKKEEQERLRPILKIKCDPNDEGLFTKCCYDANKIPLARSFKIRVFNEGLTTARKIQLKVIKFSLIKKINEDRLSQDDCNYSFLKLNWSYQDERERINLPHETKMDIQSKSYEDCDFLFILPQNKEAKLGTEQSEVRLRGNLNCFFYIQISGDNIQAEEHLYHFSIDYDSQEIISNFKEMIKQQ